MKTSILKISQLEEFLTSEICRSSEILPVSPERVASYVNNPRASDDMDVLYLLIDNDKIVAYRSLLPDWYFSKGEKKSFAWLSGNYVLPEYRRKGLSSALFKVVESQWDGKLMYTNYAPASKAVYDKTGSFLLFKERPGTRYYMRSSLKSLYKERIKYQGLLSLADGILNRIHDPGLHSQNYKLPEDVKVSQITLGDEGIKEVIENNMSGTLFQRGVKEFQWITAYPWITTRKKKDSKENYHFSRFASQFETKWYRLSHAKNSAFLWIAIVDDKIAVPYFLNEDPLLTVAARQLVIKTMVEYRSSYLTIRHPELGPVMGVRKNPFLLKREMSQNYFCHRSLLDDLPEDPEIMDGDGDCVFT